MNRNLFGLYLVLFIVALVGVGFGSYEIVVVGNSIVGNGVLIVSIVVGGYAIYKAITTICNCGHHPIK